MTAVVPERLATALEPRVKAAVLYVAGLKLQRSLPEADPFHYAPRVRIPVLMLNGRYDFFFPIETSQIPLYRLLGSPADAKRHVVYDGAHFVPRAVLMREVPDNGEAAGAAQARRDDGKGEARRRMYRRRVGSGVLGPESQVAELVASPAPGLPGRAEPARRHLARRDARERVTADHCGRCLVRDQIVVPRWSAR